MNGQKIAVAFFCIICLGCRSLPVSPNADSNWIHDFDRADSIVLTNLGIEQVITDKKIIARLGNIYSAAKFETYWHTLPSSLGEKTIAIYSNGSKLRSMSYTGVLWEHSKELSDRTAMLSDEDRQWIESLFESIKPKNHNRRMGQTQKIITRRVSEGRWGEETQHPISRCPSLTQRVGMGRR